MDRPVGDVRDLPLKLCSLYRVLWQKQLSLTCSRAVTVLQVTGRLLELLHDS